MVAFRKDYIKNLKGTQKRLFNNAEELLILYMHIQRGKLN